MFIIVRKATYNDMPELLRIAKTFTDESGWGWTYNEQKAIKKYSVHIQDTESDVIIVTEGDQIIGTAIVAFDDEFHDERLGFIIKFYITKEGRKTNAARLLRDACNAWTDSYGCTDTFLTATAKVGEDKLFVNLFKKGGYIECGSALVRKYE